MLFLYVFSYSFKTVTHWMVNYYFVVFVWVGWSSWRRKTKRPDRQWYSAAACLFLPSDQWYKGVQFSPGHVCHMPWSFRERSSSENVALWSWLSRQVYWSVAEGEKLLSIFPCLVLVRFIIASAVDMSMKSVRWVITYIFTN